MYYTTINKVMVSVLNEFGGVNKHGLTKAAFMKRKEEAG